MLKQIVGLAFVLVVLSALVACDTLKGLWGVHGPMIEQQLAVAVEGEYTFTVSKDGKPLVQETWICTRAQEPGGKLTGCHKVATSPPTPEVTPVNPAPTMMKAPR
jgi:hypothetical protein